MRGRGGNRMDIKKGDDRGKATGSRMNEDKSFTLVFDLEREEILGL